MEKDKEHIEIKSKKKNLKLNTELKESNLTVIIDDSE